MRPRSFFPIASIPGPSRPCARRSSCFIFSHCALRSYGAVSQRNVPRIGTRGEHDQEIENFSDRPLARTTPLPTTLLAPLAGQSIRLGRHYSMAQRWSSVEPLPVDGTNVSADELLCTILAAVAVRVEQYAIRNGETDLSGPVLPSREIRSRP